MTMCILHGYLRWAGLILVLFGYSYVGCVTGAHGVLALRGLVLEPCRWRECLGAPWVPTH